MAEVALDIGGHSYTLVCREGEEPHLRAMAAIIDTKAQEARTAVGGLSEVRGLVFAALLLADELNDLRKGTPIERPVASAESPDITASLAQFADRIEAIASALEKQSI